MISGGVALGDSSGGSNATNRSGGRTYVAWCLKANGAGSSDDSGGITVTRSTASHQGFSICKGTSTSGTQNFAHGLGAKPEFVIVRDLEDNSQHWQVQHKDVNTNMADITTLGLNRTNAAGSSSGWWGSEPTSTLQYFSSNHVTDGNEFVAYLFRRISGLIGIGSYTGNNSTDGPYVVVDDGASGFRPAWIMIKRSDSGTHHWRIWDSARSVDNVVEDYLSASSSGQEYGAGVGKSLDFLASGFKIRTTDTDMNASGGTYIYLAFADKPFNLARAR